MKAKYLEEIEVTDPDSKSPVAMSVFKHDNGGMFAIDSSYLEQVFEDDTRIIIPDPFIEPRDEDIELTGL